MIVWRGPLPNPARSTTRLYGGTIYWDQSYEMYIGALVHIGTLYGRGGQYHGSFHMSGGQYITVKGVTLNEGKAAFMNGLAVWMANAGLSFDEELLKLVPRKEEPCQDTNIRDSGKT